MPAIAAGGIAGADTPLGLRPLSPATQLERLRSSGWLQRGRARTTPGRAIVRAGVGPEASPAGRGTTKKYVVQPKDTIRKIAREHDMEEAELRSLNPEIRISNTIQPLQTLAVRERRSVALVEQQRFSVPNLTRPPPWAIGPVFAILVAIVWQLLQGKQSKGEETHQRAAKGSRKVTGEFLRGTKIEKEGPILAASLLSDMEAIAECPGALYRLDSCVPVDRGEELSEGSYLFVESGPDSDLKADMYIVKRTVMDIKKKRRSGRFRLL